MPDAHQTNCFTTSSMLSDGRIAHRVRFYNDHLYKTDDLLTVGHPSNNLPVSIGNDVYICAGAKIRRGVSIGNGAIVGAYSVVTKSVPPYAVVAGNPARIVKYRYSEDQIAELEGLRWWDWNFKKIISHLDVENIDSFIDGLSTLIAHGKIQAFAPKKYNLLDLIGSFSDDSVRMGYSPG